MFEELEIFLEDKLTELPKLKDTGFYDPVSYKSGQYDILFEIAEILEKYDK